MGEMRRRGVLGLIAGGLASGPSMAAKAVAGLEATTLPSLGFSGAGVAAGIGQYYHGDKPDNSEYNHGAWIRERLAELNNVTAEDRRDRIAGQYVSSLDPDLAVNRSMALWAKIAEQKRREYERTMASERKNLTRELTMWLKREVLG